MKTKGRILSFLLALTFLFTSLIAPSITFAQEMNAQPPQGETSDETAPLQEPSQTIELTAAPEQREVEPAAEPAVENPEGDASEAQAAEATPLQEETSAETVPPEDVAHQPLEPSVEPAPEPAAEIPSTDGDGDPTAEAAPLPAAEEVPAEEPVTGESAPEVPAPGAENPEQAPPEAELNELDTVLLPPVHVDQNLDGLNGRIEPDFGGFTYYAPGSLGPFGVQMMRSFHAQNAPAGGAVLATHPTVPGEVVLSKDAVPVEGMVNTWDVILRIEAMDAQKTSDIVLVMDTSGSMQGARLANAKAAATEFVNTLLKPDVNTRIALVDFSTNVTETTFYGYSQKDTLLTTIAAMTADGGTYTQAGMHQANLLLDASTADVKNIVLLSDGQPTFSAAINDPYSYMIPTGTTSNGLDVFHTSTQVPEAAYDYNTRVGNGSNLTDLIASGGVQHPEGEYFNYNGRLYYEDSPGNYQEYPRVSVGWNTYYHRFPEDGRILYTRTWSWGSYTYTPFDYTGLQPYILGDFYYNNGNSAIAEAGFAKADGYTVYTIALDAGQTGTQILNRMASPGKAYQTTNPEDLNAIFAEIADLIDTTARNASVSDPMGTGFAVVGSVSDILVSQGVAEYDAATKTISWDIGNLTEPIEPGSDIKYAQMTYRVTIDDDILGADPTDPEQGLYAVNGNASFAYTNPDGLVVTENFPVPSVHPILLVLEKVLLDARGNRMTDDRQFFVHVSSAGDQPYNSTYTLTGNQKRVLTNLKYEETYTVRESVIGGTPLTYPADYRTTVAVTGPDVTGDDAEKSFFVSETQQQYSVDRDITVTNQELPLGKLTVYKQFIPSAEGGTPGTGAPGADAPVFRIKVSNGIDQDIFVDLKAGESETLEGLIYGDYTVEEVDTHGFVDSYSPAQTVKLSITDKHKEVTVTNRPQSGTDQTSFTGRKVWVNGPTADHKAVEMVLYQNGQEMANPPQVIISPDSGTSTQFSYTWNGLPKYKSDGSLNIYTLDERQVPANYVRTVNTEGTEVTNTYTVGAPASVTANKTWVNGPAASRPTVWFKLYRTYSPEDGSANVTEEVPLNEAPLKELPNGTTSVTWENLTPKTNKGEEYTFSVKEVSAQGVDFTPANYQKVESGLNVTNTYSSPTADVTVTKTWQNGPKPSIQVKLLRNDEDYLGPVTLDGVIDDPVAADGSGELAAWQYTWKNLDLTDSSGTAYVYTVQELDIPENYGAAYDQTSLTITNTYTIPKNAQAEASKVWVNGPADNRPDIWFRLWRSYPSVNESGEAITVKEVVPDVLPGQVTTGPITWTGLAETTIDGAPYTFFVREGTYDGTAFTEGAPENYSADEVDDLTVTNTYVIPDSGVVQINKEWVNGKTEDHLDVCESLTLWRRAGETGALEKVVDEDGKPIPPGTISPDPAGGPSDVFSYSWTGLDETTIDGIKYQFFVTEEKQTNYDRSYSQYVTIDDVEYALPSQEQNVSTITNSYVSPATATVSATKIWVNGPTPRPTIWFQLWRQVEKGDPEVVPDVELKKLLSGTVKTQWEGLVETDENGKPYSFFVREGTLNDTTFEVGAPENYTADEVDDLVVTNTYNPPTGEVSARKVWDKGPATHPTVWFKLFRNEGTGTNIVPVEGADIKELPNGTLEVVWTDITQTNLAGKPYTFYVKEVDAEGNDFTPEQYVKAENLLTVTNTYVIPDKGTAEATKTWINGPKPTVWLQLWREIDGDDPEVVPGAPLKEMADGATTANWTGLEETDEDGNVYIFSVREVDADGKDFTPENYSKEEDGLVVTNIYSIPTGEIKAQKAWINGPDVKPTVWFKLYRTIDDAKTSEPVPEAETKELANGTLEVSWEDVELTDIDGNVYEFFAVEVDKEGNDFTPPHYTKSEDGLIVTNTYVPPTGELVVMKFWEGKGNPFEVTVQLKRDGVNYLAPVTLDGKVDGAGEDPGWTYTWEDIALTDEKGRDYVFAVEELNVPANYDVKYSRDTVGTLLITNTFTGKPGITLEKTVDKDKFNKVGEVLTYTFKVTNTGLRPLENIKVDDPMFGEISLDKTTLLPGEIATGTASYTVTEADVKAGKVYNAAKVTSECPDCPDPGGEDPSDEDEVIIPHDPLSSGLAFEKTVDKKNFSKAGEVLTYTFTVKNTGETDLQNIKVHDPMFKEVVLDKKDLKPGEVATGTASYTVTAADVKAGKVYNAATVTSDCPDCPDPSGPSGKDDITVDYKAPKLPSTGSESESLFFFGGLALIGLGTLTIRRKRKTAR